MSFKDLRTKFTPSDKVILNLVISVLVRVNLFPLLYWSKKIGITDPLENITFPYLTTENFVFFEPTKLFEDTNNLSETNFVAPYKLIGDEALSVLKAITLLILLLIEALITFSAQ